MPFDQSDTLRDAAQRWYDHHLGEHLHRDRAQAARRCAAYLVSQWPVDAVRALEISLQVLGLVEQRACPASIDTDRTTSHTLFLKHNGRVVVFTAADLMRFALASESCPVGEQMTIAPLARSH